MKKLLGIALVAAALFAVAPLAAMAQDNEGHVAGTTAQSMPPTQTYVDTAPYATDNPDFGRLGS
jgi:predicted secreted protein